LPISVSLKTPHKGCQTLYYVPKFSTWWQYYFELLPPGVPFLHRMVISSNCFAG